MVTNVTVMMKHTLKSHYVHAKMKRSDYFIKQNEEWKTLRKFLFISNKRSGYKTQPGLLKK